MLGVVLAALSAATFAFNNASARRGVLTGSVAQALAITVPIGVPIFFVAALTTGYLGVLSHFSGEAMGLLALAGVLHFVVGRYGNFRAAQAIGANLSGPVMQLSLGVTLVLAVLVLKEAMTPLRILGIALLALAPALMRNATAEAIGAPDSAHALGLPKFQPRYAEGYAFSIMAALVYGVTPLLIRLAIIGGDLGTGVASVLVPTWPPPQRSRCCCCGPASCAMRSRSLRKSLKWFTYSGISVSIAQMFIYMAYAIAPISVVTPILHCISCCAWSSRACSTLTMRYSAAGWCWGHFCRCSAQSRSRSISSVWPGAVAAGDRCVRALALAVRRRVSSLRRYRAKEHQAGGH